MRNSRISTLIAAAGLLAALPAAWGDQAAPATPAAPVMPATPVATGTAMRGQVTAVDATAKTVTVQDRNGTATVLHIGDTTKYLVDGTGAMSDVKVGQTVRVMGQTDGTTITARGIQVLPPEEAALPAPGGGGGGGGRRFGTMGVVATLTPTMTITTPDKQTDTVATDSSTRVTTSHSGTLADVKPDANVSAITTGSGDTVTASVIHVRAAYGGGRPGGGNGGPAPAPAAPATPAPAPATPAPGQ